jgi:CHAT domain-containing protein
MVLEALGLAPIAAEAWTAYLRVDPASSWSAEARRRLAAMPKTDYAGWTEATVKITELTDARIAELTARYPQQARAHAEGQGLQSWATAFLQNDSSAANALRCVRVIGSTLRLRFDERLLSDSVSVIDKALEARDTVTAGHIAQGLVAYQKGLPLYYANELAQGESLLGQSVELLQSAHVPLARLAEFRRACALYDRQRMVEARGRLAALLATERSSPHPYYGLLALTLYETALLEGARGYWSDSIAAANEAEATFRRIGERGYAMAMLATAAEDADFIGQPNVAWKDGVTALTGSCAAGDYYRTRTILGLLCRVELRHGDWEGAAAMARLEDSLVRNTANPRTTVSQGRNPANPLLQSDMLLRWATAEDQLGDHSRAQVLLQRAFVSARALPAGESRDKLVSDVSAVAGAMARRDNPQASVALMTVSIDFQRTAGRALLLPELLLTRGRALVALGRIDKAARDFESGIAELESSRTRVTDQAFRPGIFEDAADLFDEAIAAELTRSDPAAAFGYVERGRARAMLEQMTEGELPRWSSEEIVHSLPPDSLLVEYAPLRDRIAIFTIDGDGLRVCTVPMSRDELRQTVRAFNAGLKDKDDINGVRRLAAALHRQLLAPIRARIDRASTVVVVPDGLLQEVPFTALFDEHTSTYFVERKFVTTAPSAAVYARLLHGHGEALPAIASPTQNTLIFANPRLRSDLYGDFANLGAAQQEARRVAARDAHAVIRTAADATASAFLELAPTAETVEFAGHAVVDYSEPWRSALLFASSGGDTGALTSSDIARMHLPRTQLVILSACSTLRGFQRRVDGPPSVARMFLVAGVPTVIGTLWDIEDQDAGDFTNALHRNLAGGKSPAQALRDVQLSALHGPDIRQRHPGYWAVFSLLGGVSNPPLPRSASLTAAAR